MIILWQDIFFLKGTLIIDDFIIITYDMLAYSTYFLVFKFEKFDANQAIFFIMLSSMLGTLLEQFGLVSNPAFTYPYVFGLIQWNPLITLGYFACMFGLGFILIMFFIDKERLKALLRNES